jgi:hypothetical protein
MEQVDHPGAWRHVFESFGHTGEKQNFAGFYPA